MRYVIIRDDDLNALTPIDSLEKLYRPFLQRGLPVNLATIPLVNTKACIPSGAHEEFLLYRKDSDPSFVSIGSNPKLVDYILSHPLYHIAQHGYHHNYHEFASQNQEEIIHWLEDGLRLMEKAGFPRAAAFVAPQDVISKTAMDEIVKRFPVVVKNWYAKNMLPLRFWPPYFLKKLQGHTHFRARNITFLERERSYLAHDFPLEQILDKIEENIASETLTVIATHWWSFFKDPSRTERLIQVYHTLADRLAKDQNIRVITYKDLLDLSIPLH